MIAIIPARGGSKGLPGKNTKILNGKPLIAYTIEAAIRSRLISRVIVSTDSVEITQVALQYGAEVPFMRPDELATDSAKSIDVYVYTLERIGREGGIQYNECVILQPTSPLRNYKHIDEAIELFYSKRADSVVSYCKEDHPVFWHKFIDKEGRFESIFSGDFLENRQEIRSTYYPNGAIYIFRKELLLNSKYYTKNSFAYLMDKKSSIDIDTIEDFELSEYHMKYNI